MHIYQYVGSDSHTVRFGIVIQLRTADWRGALIDLPACLTLRNVKRVKVFAVL